MGEYRNTTVKDVVMNYINRIAFLPAIQREFVWETDEICKLFDSLMCRYPISSFLFWKIRSEDKKNWDAYKFINVFDEDNPHNEKENLDGTNNDLYLILDGQQRMTSLYIGLKGSYTSSSRGKKKTKYLALDLLKAPTEKINPDELKYGFAFIEETEFNDSNHCWYRVGDILNYDRPREAKEAITEKISKYTGEQQKIIENNMEDLHTTIHVSTGINYYEESTNNYDEVVEIFVRTNTGGMKLEYSDILLSMATVKWQRYNAREEINNFTDDINKIGAGYNFGKDFVMKGALYLTNGLPIQYKVSSFTKENLKKIEDNWENIKTTLRQTVLLLYKFGFSDKNIVSKNVALPIALYIKNKNISNFVISSDTELMKIKNAIQKWFVLNTLRNAFGGSSDTTLRQCQEILETNSGGDFPYSQLNKKLLISPTLSAEEIQAYFKYHKYQYGSKYSYLLLSLLYPNRDWRDSNYDEDHIFPKAEFDRRKLAKRGYSSDKIDEYMANYNTIVNLELLDGTENNQKRATPFDVWINTRDDNFKKRHLIPEMASYDFDHFLDFIEARKELLAKRYSEFSFE